MSKTLKSIKFPGLEDTYVIPEFVVDEALSETSTNPVQNKVISAAISQLSSDIDAVIPVPVSTSSDNGKFLRVVDGTPTWATVLSAEEASF